MPLFLSLSHGFLFIVMAGIFFQFSASNNRWWLFSFNFPANINNVPIFSFNSRVSVSVLPIYIYIDEYVTRVHTHIHTHFICVRVLYILLVYNNLFVVIVVMANTQLVYKRGVGTGDRYQLYVAYRGKGIILIQGNLEESFTYC